MFGKLGRIFHFYERRELFLDFQKERSSLRPLLISLSRFIHTDHCGVEREPAHPRYVLQKHHRDPFNRLHVCVRLWSLWLEDFSSLCLSWAKTTVRDSSLPPRGLFSPLASANRFYNVLHRFCISVPPGHQSAKPRMRICCSYCIFSSICFNI